jgi:hypothetical protein
VWLKPVTDKSATLSFNQASVSASLGGMGVGAGSAALPSITKIVEHSATRSASDAGCIWTAPVPGLLITLYSSLTLGLSLVPSAAHNESRNHLVEHTIATKLKLL